MSTLVDMSEMDGLLLNVRSVCARNSGAISSFAPLTTRPASRIIFSSARYRSVEFGFVTIHFFLEKWISLKR